MAYTKILQEFQLTGSAAPAHADNPTQGVLIYDLTSGVPVLGLVLQYLAGDATGYPGYELDWYVPGVEWVPWTVRDETPSISESGDTATLSEYKAVAACKDLLGSDGTGPRARTHDVFPGATRVRFKPYEIGNTGDAGILTAWMGRA